MAVSKTSYKSYVGSTVRTLELRIIDHLSRANKNSNFAFHCAIRKYGIDDFVWFILEETDFDSRLDREKFWIEQFGYPHGYNMTTKTGGGPMPKEVREKISQTLKGNQNAKGHVCKHTEETKQKMSESHTGVKRGSYKRKGVSAQND